MALSCAIFKELLNTNFVDRVSFLKRNIWIIILRILDIQLDVFKSSLIISVGVTNFHFMFERSTGALVSLWLAGCPRTIPIYKLYEF